MTDAVPSLRSRARWARLEAHAAELRDTTLRELFAADPGRGGRMHAEVAGLYLDYSKHRVTDETLALLVDLADEIGLRERIGAMFRGDHVNVSEDRPALHVALRMARGETLVVDGTDVVAEVHAVLDRMAGFADDVRSGAWIGSTGRRVRNVVNIGIGGSDLGPRMAYEALRAYADLSLTVRFVSNVDPSDLVEALHDLDPAETMFVVCSKTFTTLETMTNAASARRWIRAGLGDDAAIDRHFVAVSTNEEQVRAFGIDVRNMFGFWDWVGGRYSMGSAVGLSTMIAIGPERFHEMLAGFRAVDEHFRRAPFDENVPALMGLLAVWYRNFLGAQTFAVVPYAQDLARLPAYLQQLTMESNGKSTTDDGDPVEVDTGAVCWGAPGTDGQHSFFQLLHQGTATVPVDLVAFAKPRHALGDHHDLLSANVFAQAKALAFGSSGVEPRADVSDAAAPHRAMPGNRPTSVILAEQLDPFRLGALVACYEHSVLVQAAIWGIDPFDQWGVELGKQVAREIAPQLIADSDPTLDHDSSTNALIMRYRALKRT